MSHPARRIDRILSDAPLAATLLARIAAGREAARIIASICAEVAPDFDPAKPGACDLRDQVLRIWLRSSAHSTKLRQAIPRLTAQLQRHGLKVNEIKVGVQLGRVREKFVAQSGNNARMARPFPAPAESAGDEYLMPIAFSEELALTLPDSPLRRAALRLGQSLQTRLAGMRESDQTFNRQDDEEKRPQHEAGDEDAPRP